MMDVSEYINRYLFCIKLHGRFHFQFQFQNIKMLGGISTLTETSGYPTSCKGKYIVTIVSLNTLK